MKCQCDATTPRGVRICPQCGGTVHDTYPVMRQPYRESAAKVHEAKKRGAAILSQRRAASSVPSVVTAMIELQFHSKRTKVKRQPAQIARSSFFVLMTMDHAGRPRAACRSASMLSYGTRRETPELRAVLDAFRRQLVAEGWEESLPPSPGLWYKYRFRRKQVSQTERRS